MKGDHSMNDYDDYFDIYEPERKKEKKNYKKWFNKTSKFFLSIFMAGILLGTGYAVGAKVGDQLFIGDAYEAGENQEPVVQRVILEQNQQTLQPVSAIAEVAGPSIVTIVSTKEVTRQYFFSTDTYEAEGTGSGILYKVTDDGLLVMTNNHVVEGADDIQVILADGQILEAVVIGYDSRNDLALIKIPNEVLEEEEIDQVVVATFGDSTKLVTGEMAVAIGNPLGKEFSQTVTAGVISSVDRTLEIDGESLTVLQTDAAINPGNSGGALLNGQGEVIGINTLKFVDSSVEGMGFAIPIHIALPIIEKIEGTGEGLNVAYLMDDDRAYLGISMGSLPEETNQSNMSFGVFVKEVLEDGPAEKAGLEEKDYLFALDGYRIADSTSLFDLLSKYEPEDTVRFTVLRGDDVLEIDVKLGRYGDYKEVE